VACQLAVRRRPDPFRATPHSCGSRHGMEGEVRTRAAFPAWAVRDGRATWSCCVLWFPARLVADRLCAGSLPGRRLVRTKAATAGCALSGLDGTGARPRFRNSPGERVPPRSLNASISVGFSAGQLFARPFEAVQIAEN